MKAIYTNISPVNSAYTNLNHIFSLKKHNPQKVYLCVWDNFVYEHPAFERDLDHTTNKVEKLQENVKILEKFGVNGDKIYVAYSPERVLPGQTMRELVENNRIVGGITREAALHVMLFYETFIQGEVLITDARTAEMTKLTENANRDVNIAFANELSILCEKFNINVWELIELANKHPRINILKPGSGVGGHCIAVDPWFIIKQAEKEKNLKVKCELTLILGNIAGGNVSSLIVTKIHNLLFEFLEGREQYFRMGAT